MKLSLIKFIFNITIKLRKFPYELNYKFNNFVNYLKLNTRYLYEEDEPKKGKVNKIMLPECKNWMLTAHLRSSKVGINNKDFRTSDLKLSIFLVVKGERLIGVDTVNVRQKQLIFENTPNLEELKELYRFGDKSDKRLLIHVKEYESTRKELLDRLNEV